MKKVKNTIINFLSEQGFKIKERNTGHIVKDSWVYGKRI